MRFRQLGAAMVAAALVASSAACSHHHKQSPPTQPTVAYATPHVIGQGAAKITVQGSQVPANVQSVVDAQVKPSLPGAVGVGSVLAITPAGKLPAGVTLSFPVTGSKPITAADGLYIASAESAAGPWTLQRTTIDDNGHSLQVATDHFSFWSEVKLDVGAAVTELKHDFLDGISGDFTTEAAKPSCQNESKARTNGYAITSSAKDTLYWCFGLQTVKGKQHRVLKVVNRRRYPELLKHSGLKFLSRSRTAISLADIARFDSGGTLVMPFQEADFIADLSAGSHGSLNAELSGPAQSLYQLEVGLTTASSIVTRFGANEDLVEIGALKENSFDKLAAKMDTAFQIKDCPVAILHNNPGEVLKSCFSPADLAKYFGWQGVILAPFVVAGSLLEFFRSEFNSLGDQLNGRDKYTVTVKRKADFSRFVGHWAVCGGDYTQDLTVNSDATAVLHVQDVDDPAPLTVTMHLVTYNSKPAVQIDRSDYSSMSAGSHRYLEGSADAQIWFQVPGDPSPLLEAMSRTNGGC